MLQVLQASRRMEMTESRLLQAAGSGRPMPTGRRVRALPCAALVKACSEMKVQLLASSYVAERAASVSFREEKVGRSIAEIVFDTGRDNTGAIAAAEREEA
jgi:hypothetical protein